MVKKVKFNVSSTGTVDSKVPNLGGNSIKVSNGYIQTSAVKGLKPIQVDSNSSLNQLRLEALKLAKDVCCGRAGGCSGEDIMNLAVLFYNFITKGTTKV